jgi:hypothetical protein
MVGGLSKIASGRGENVTACVETAVKLHQPAFFTLTPGSRLRNSDSLGRIETQREGPLVAQTSVCVLFSAPTQIKTTQAEACATGLPQNSSEKCALIFVGQEP